MRLVKALALSLFTVLLSSGVALCESSSLIANDFEGDSGFWPYSGDNSLAEVENAYDDGAVGQKALHIVWDVHDFAGCGITIPSGTIDSEYSTLRFMFKGTGKGRSVRLLLSDADKEQFAVVIKDTSSEWRTLEYPLNGIPVRRDYQIADIEKNKKIDYPISGMQIESMSNGEIEIWLDQVEFSK